MKSLKINCSFFTWYNCFAPMFQFFGVWLFIWGFSHIFDFIQFIQHSKTTPFHYTESKFDGGKFFSTHNKLNEGIFSMNSILNAAKSVLLIRLTDQWWFRIYWFMMVLCEFSYNEILNDAYCNRVDFSPKKIEQEPFDENKKVMQSSKQTQTVLNSLVGLLKIPKLKINLNA